MEIKNKIVGIPEIAFSSDFGDYWQGKTHSANKLIMNIANNYKQKQLKKMRALNPRVLNPRSRSYIKFEDGLIISIKRDGEFNLLYYDDGAEPISIFCNSPNGRARYNLPVSREIHEKIKNINESEKSLSDFKRLFKSLSKKDILNNISKIVLAGELYANVEKEHAHPRVSDFLALARNPRNMEALEKINYDVFDIISLNDVALQTIPYEFRLKIIGFLFPKDAQYESDKAKIINHETGVPGKKAQVLFNKWVEQEFHEGIIIHNNFNKTFKVKKVHTIDAVIIGFVEMLKEKRIRGFDSVSALLVALMRVDGSYQVLTRVGGGITEDQRIHLYKLLHEDVVASKYKKTNREGRAFRFVKPKYVVEIKYIDMIKEDFEGNPKLKMALEFKDDIWRIKRVVPFVALINPYFDKFRTEIDLESYPSLEHANPKSAVYEDVSIDQVLNIISLESPKTISEIKVFPRSEIIFKIIYNVRWGGVESAKKLLIWKTNKDELDKSYPKYVIYYADYSYLRSKPLEQMVYPFNSIEKALEHINFIYTRPDNPSKGLLDAKTQTMLKKSIKTPPIHFFIKDDIKDILNLRLEAVVRNIIFG